jgi:hypothetical protein
MFFFQIVILYKRKIIKLKLSKWQILKLILLVCEKFANSR